MKSFEDVKARFIVGQEIEVVNHVLSKASGRWLVTNVCGSGYWFRRLPARANETNCWFAFPKTAAKCKIDGPDRVTFRDGDSGIDWVTIDFGPVTP